MKNPLGRAASSLKRGVLSLVVKSGGLTYTERLLASLGRLLIAAGLALLLPGLLLLFLASSPRLQAFGSVIAGLGGSSLLGAAGLYVSLALSHRDRQHDRSVESRQLAARLQSLPTLDGQNAVGSRLFHTTDLRGKSFKRAILDDACWYNVDISGCDFEAASLLRTKLGCDSFRVCTGVETSFDRAEMGGAELHGHFYKAQFRGASLSYAKLNDTLLDCADFGPDALGSNTDLRNAQFDSSSGLDGASFRRADCRDANFSGSHLYGTSFEEAFLVRASFDNATLSGISFRGAMLSYAVGVHGATFRKTEFDMFGKCDFRDAWLLGVDFSESRFIEKVPLDGALVFLGATLFPQGFDPAANGAIMLTKKSLEEETERWLEVHAKPFGRA